MPGTVFDVLCLVPTIFFLELGTIFGGLGFLPSIFFGAWHGARHDFWGPWLGAWHFLLELGTVPGTNFGVLGLAPGKFLWSLA